MADAIGPNFTQELKVKAGLTDFRFAWGADGAFTFHPDMPQAQRDLVLAVFAAHDPLTPLTFTDAELDARFDAGEKMFKALALATLTVVNDLRTDPTTVKAALTVAQWRGRIVTAFKALP